MMDSSLCHFFRTLISFINRESLPSTMHGVRCMVLGHDFPVDEAYELSTCSILFLLKQLPLPGAESVVATLFQQKTYEAYRVA